MTITSHGESSAERVMESPGNPWFEEHRSRYLWAGQFVSGKAVLDAACGTGHGLTTMREGGASWVLGVDRSSEIRNADRSAANLEVCQADLSSIPLKDGSFDVVTSFETIEHLVAPENFLDEILRVLRPDGSLLMSTPNGALTRKSRRGAPVNPYHVREFFPAELAEMVSERFEVVTLLGQTVSADFGVCPFWDARPKLERAKTMGFRGATWSALARLPRRTAERWAGRILGQSMYPAAADFEFNEAGLSTAHVFIVKAHRPMKNKRGS